MVKWSEICHVMSVEVPIHPHHLQVEYIELGQL